MQGFLVQLTAISLVKKFTVMKRQGYTASHNTSQHIASHNITTHHIA